MTDPEIDRLLALAEVTPPEMVCANCGSPAEFIVGEGIYRHKGTPHEDQYFGQTFCDRYGYPIPVVDAAGLALRPALLEVRKLRQQRDTLAALLRRSLAVVGPGRVMGYDDTEELWREIKAALEGL